MGVGSCLDQYVLGLDISVYYALLMQVFESPQQLKNDLFDLFRV